MPPFTQFLIQKRFVPFRFPGANCATQYRDRIVGAMHGQTNARLAKQAGSPEVSRPFYGCDILPFESLWVAAPPDTITHP